MVIEVKSVIMAVTIARAKIAVMAAAVIADPPRRLSSHHLVTVCTELRFDD
ncbi:hypothetical protein CES86_2315 [Brucella lupini]|uniref:Uncharacterized protein n=1 Tax=Brucella lupini TaxID=255457 RepID=A0A256GT39_9HYPH|nr:hypothetical protein CES86_2315 [Brucella lupini]